ncbi:Dyp-type peroxidase [Bergeriella denitrificans]|uniref:Putative peroxidase n=1 Tax=Bergeriella denitrificans TaxID=494 RepID=A0A378UIA5_BERDE|nr:Dyp-type peroxidase [Bergeriella denitrificans]STZ76212.1 putative peroxidase [Bergeriella denitrificans]
MARPQTAIIPDHCKAGIFIEADIHAGQTAQIKAACRSALAALSDLQTQFPDASLGLSIAFGSSFWQTLNHAQEGREIKPFRALGNGLAPATQHDVMIHIQSMRQDLNFALAERVLAAFGGSISVQSETHGLRLLENRGTDGFVDGTENPQGDDNVRQVGIIADGQPDAGGSYVLLQKYRHNLKKWQGIGIPDQEADVGRSKAANEEFSRDVRLTDSHLGRVNLKENGVGLKIVRRSLPYGTVSGENGLMFISYCHTLHNIEAQLLSMFGETDGQTDRLLAHLSTAVSGAYYYAPSAERLGDL